MNRRLLLVLGLAALAAALAIYVLRGDRGRRDRAASTTASGPAAGGATAGRGGARAGTGVVDPRTQTPASIAGTIRTDGGGPLAGARVCTSWFAEGATDDDRREPTCTSSGGDGAYLLRAVVAGTHRVFAFADGHLPAAWRDPDPERDRAWFELAPGQARTGVDLALAPGGAAVSGVVEDVSGGPVVDAVVEIRADRGWWSRGEARTITRSDEHGRFTTWTRAGQLTVSAAADGYAPGHASAVAPSAQIVVLLTPESVLAGRVIEAGSGAPVPDAIVSVGDWRAGDESSDASTRTDDDGRFRLTRLSPGRYKPGATARGRFGEPTESVLLGLGQTVEDVVIEVHAAAAVRGRVVIEDGAATRPCADAWVNLRDATADRWQGDGADDDGRVELISVLPGRYEVSIYCEGYLARDRYDAVVVASADVDGLVWTVGPGGRIRGTVRTAGGEPVADASVSARVAGGAARAQRSWGHDTSRADGTFRMKGLAAGDYAVEVHASGQRGPDEAPRVTVPPGGEGSIDVVLPAGGTIAGAVVDTDGKPVSGARVRVANDGWSWGAGEGRTDDDGRFAIEGVRPGERRVVASRGWSQTMRRPGSSDDDVQGERVTVAAGATATVRLVVEARAGVIRGAVTDERGQPVGDAWVIASRVSEASGRLASSAARDTRWSWGRDDRPVITGPDGRFAVRELAPGRYAVRAYRRGGGEAVAEQVEVGATVSLVIRATGSLAGTVAVAGGGAPPDELHVAVSDEQTGFSRRERFFRTGGAFALHDLPAGTFVVSVDAAGGRGLATVALAIGERKTGLTLVLERKVRVRGRMVELGTTTPVAGMQAIVQPVRGVSTSTFVMSESGDRQHISGDDGRFELADVPTGKSWLVAWPLAWDSSPWAGSRTYVELDAAAGEVIDVGDVEVLRRRKRTSEPDGDLGFTLVQQPPDQDPPLTRLEVALVRPQGPAARAGLAVGDVIVSVDGHDVRGAHSSRARPLWNVLEGTEVTLGLARGASVRIKAGPPL